MKVGVPTEVKTDEYRVALTPAGVRELVDAGHTVLVQAGAGLGSAITDEMYTAQGATILPDAAAVFGEAEMIVKVKEPQPAEVAMIESRHTLFTYLHLAAEPELTRGLMESGALCIAYETVEDARGRLPLLAPMSRGRGQDRDPGRRVHPREAARRPGHPARRRSGRRGRERDDHRRRGRRHARRVHRARDGGDRVRVRPLIERLRELDIAFGGRADTCFATTLSIEERLPDIDLVIGAVLVHGARAPHVITREQLALMKRHAVLVDVSIDQGGCFETSRPTTHSDPTYEVDGITHYCVANMPGAVPITSTYALTNATMPYVLELANLGVAGAIKANPGLRLGVNVAAGHVTYAPVAEAVGVPYVPVEEAPRRGWRRRIALDS